MNQPNSNSAQEAKFLAVLQDRRGRLHIHHRVCLDGAHPFWPISQQGL